MTEQEIREKLIERLTYAVRMSTESLRTAVAEWSKRAESDAAWKLSYDFAWSGSTFDRAATLKEEAALLEHLERVDEETGEPLPLRKVYEWYTEDVVRGARSPEQSTGPMHNFMERAELAAKAVLLERLRFSITAIENL
jgi:hypothetical protein